MSAKVTRLQQHYGHQNNDKNMRAFVQQAAIATATAAAAAATVILGMHGANV